MEEKKLTGDEIVKDLERYNDEQTIENALELIHRLQDENAEQKAEIERLTEKASYQRLELCKEIAELQKKVENQKAVIIGQAERMEKEKAENKRLYDEFVRLNDFCATKGCICCICENKKTCNECSKCGSLKTEKCNKFKIDVSKYARAIERADKLQKQVDELTTEKSDGFLFFSQRMKLGEICEAYFREHKILNCAQSVIGHLMRLGLLNVPKAKQYLKEQNNEKKK